MEDTFIVRNICELFGFDTPEDEDVFVTSSDIGHRCLEELLHMEYTVELGYMSPYTYSVVAKKWLPPEDQEDGEESFEYAFSTDEFLTRAIMQVLIKVLGP